MGNLSAIKKVLEVMSVKSTDLFDFTGGRKIPFQLDEERIYIIPGYQREISWTAENVQILIDDLKKGSKFLGTITFSTFREKEFEVIDGQQRLTVIRLIIEYLNTLVPIAKRFENICQIHNDSFANFDDALKYKFDYEKMQVLNKEAYDRLVTNDVLNQRNNFLIIWKSIEQRINLLTSRECEELLTALLESDLNVIINRLDGTDTKRKFCVDYFIDINNKSVELESVDIIRAYAFREDFERMSRKWVQLQEKCSKLSSIIKYSRKELFYQYFICKVNSELEYQLTKPFGEKYTIKEDVLIKGCNYSCGTFVWNLFSNDKFYSGLLDDLNNYLDFIRFVVTEGSSRAHSFKKYFKISEEKVISDTTISNVFSIINSIIRNDDVVPKIMVMKYYLDIMENDYCKSSQYKIIYYINVVSLIFSSMSKNKSSELIASKILLKEWSNAIQKMAYKMLLEAEKYIDYKKVALINKSYTVESGQYLARRYYTVFEAYTWYSGNISIDEKKYALAIITDGKKNDEHFLVNRNYEYALYNKAEEIDVKINTPRKYKSYIATLANYIWLDSDVNSLLHNRPVYEKIKILENKIDKLGMDAVIVGLRSQQHYACVKFAFYDSSKYPAKKINDAKKKSEKKKLLSDYYKNNFEDEFSQLIYLLSSEARIYEVYMGYMLKRLGFEATDEKDEYEYNDVTNCTLTVVVDGNNKEMNASYEILNPYYPEEPEDLGKYSLLLEKYEKAFCDIWGKRVCSDLCGFGCEDESYMCSVNVKSIDEIKKIMNVIEDVERNIIDE